jgi:hypothetical protein
MPKRTLLDMTQNILNEMESDEVNSIGDTTESAAVAQIIETTYYDLIANITVPEHFELMQLVALADTAQPNFLQYPSTMTLMEWFKYDSRDDASDIDINYIRVEYLNPTTFMERINSRDSSANEVDTITDATSSVKLLIKNNANPTYWTTFDDNYLVCDSYDSSIESTLQASKTQAWGKKEPTFTQTDLFIPDMDIDKFPLLLAVSKSAAFASLKGAQAFAASTARSSMVKNQNNRHRAIMASGYGQPNYGRK